MDDSGYRRLEDGAALPRRAARLPARRWLPGVTLLVAFIVSFGVWAAVIFAAIRFWHRL